MRDIKAKKPFEFYSRLNLQQLTGIKARNLKELLKGIRKVTGAVIYHHTHRFLQQHQYLLPEPPNDFAYWVTEVLGEYRLGEKLLAIDTVQFKSIRALRNKIIETIENESRNLLKYRNVPAGKEFHFIKSISFYLPTGYAANTIAEFVEILRQVSLRSIYFHIFEARLRLEKGANDFSFWLDTSCGRPELARQLEALDPYTYTMDALRRKIIDIIQKGVS
jgi:hypothetical protein